MKIFVINGYATAGKDTFCYYVQDCARQDGVIDIHIMSTIDNIKQLAMDMLGWNGEKNEKSRKMLCNLKNLLTEWNDLPYQNISKMIHNLYIQDATALFIHCREPEEIQRFVDDFKAETIFIDRKTDTKFNNDADKNVENYSYDYIIDNNHTKEDLYFAAKEFYNNHIKN
jgi:hypothetical protein